MFPSFHSALVFLELVLILKGVIFIICWQWQAFKSPWEAVSRSVILWGGTSGDTSKFLTCLIKKFGGSIDLICSDLALCQTSNRCCQTVESSLFHCRQSQCQTGRHSTVCKMAAWSDTRRQCCTILLAKCWIRNSKTPWRGCTFTPRKMEEKCSLPSY